MHFTGLLLACAFTAAASQGATDHTTEQQPLLENTPFSAWTHDEKTARAKTLLKVSSDGQASSIPEIAKLAIDISATSNTSQADAIERLGLSILQVEFLLSDQKAANVLETYIGTSTRVLNDKDSLFYFNDEEKTDEDAVKVINYKAETFFTARGTPGADIEDIRSIMRELREMPDVKTQSIEWELSESSRDKIRIEAKRKAVQKCLSQGKETAKILGFEEGVMLMQVEESNSWVQEKSQTKMRVNYWPARGDEIDARPNEMEIEATMSCTFKVV